MTRFEMRLLRAILGRAAILTALLAWLLFVLLLSRHASTSADGVSVALTTMVLEHCVRVLDLVMMVAAPAATVLAIVRYRRLGVLRTALAAGLTPRRLARVIVISALAALAVAAMVPELVGRERTEDNEVRLYRAGDAFAWLPEAEPDARPERAIVFRAGTLDVSVASVAAQRSPGAVLHLRDGTPLFGAGVGVGVDAVGFRPSRPALRPLHPGSLVSALAAGAPLREAVVSLNRAILGALSLIILGPVALLVPRRRLWIAYAAPLVVVPALALPGIAASLWVWRGAVGAVAVEVMWLALPAIILVALIARLEQRRDYDV